MRLANAAMKEPSPPPTQRPLLNRNKSSQHDRETDSTATEGDSRRFRHRSELARTRDVFRHLSAWKTLFNPEKMQLECDRAIDVRRAIAAEPVAQRCPDKLLSAVAQLCALQMDVRACLISTACSKNEYILADVSQSTALQERAAGASYGKVACGMGTMAFDCKEGITSSCIPTWQNVRRPREPFVSDDDLYHPGGLTAHYHIVNDVKQHDEKDAEWKKHQFVKQCPWLRFVCAVPLRSGQGSVIGALTILDDKPRFGVSDPQLGLMEELADTVVEHLHSVVVRAQQQRSQSLIQGLDIFNSGGHSMREWWQRQDDARMQEKGRNTVHNSDTSRTARADKEFGTRTDLPPEDINTPSSDDTATDDPTKVSANAQSSTLEQVTTAYDRATNLLREATGMTGVAILNIGTQFGKHGPETAGPDGDDGSSTDADHSDSSSSSQKMCETCSYSTRQQSRIDGHDIASAPLKLSEQSLRRIIKKYPEGAFFYFGDSGRIQIGSEEEYSSATSGSDLSGGHRRKFRPLKDIRTLAKAIKKVRSLAVLPMWDFTVERWRSCAFVWSDSAVSHVDDGGEMSYLRTFSHSILAEVSRLHSIAADQAKGRFISTVSHELRSPLHAILGGIEYLKDTELDSFQREMSNSVDVAAKTLLDTVDHILDYSKVSNSSRTTAKYQGIASKDAELPVVDIAELTERTVETCVASHRAQMQEKRNTASNGRHSEDIDHKGEAYSPALSRKSDVAFTLNIVPRLSWRVQMVSGAWTRILTNLVGNALKYTSKGHISVRLEASTGGESSPSSKSHGDSEKLLIRLTVQDTGIGMSQTFVSDGAFVPFKQQDPHSTGAGLGLSIVNQIAQDIGADLKLNSTQGKGTKLEIEFHAKPVPGDDPADVPHMTVDKFQLHSVPDDAGQPTPSVDRVVGGSVLESAEAYLDAKVYTDMQVQEDGDGRTAVSAITENTLRTWQREKPAELKKILTALSSKRSHILVLAETIRSVVLQGDTQELPIRAVFLHQPIGPRKLLRAIASDRDSNMADETAINQNSIERHPAAERRKTSSTPRFSTIPSRKESSFSDYPTSPATSSAPTIPDSASRDRQTILLVDDNSINLKLLVALARKLKIPYLCAVNGLEAVNLYRENYQQVALIILDMTMPVMDGYTATRTIREIERTQKLPRVYIAALTGVTDAESKSRAFEDGVDTFFSKPVGMQELCDLLQAVEKNRLT